MVAWSSATDMPAGSRWAGASEAAGPIETGNSTGPAAGLAAEVTTEGGSAGAAEVQSGRGPGDQPHVGAGGGSTDTVVSDRGSSSCGRLDASVAPVRFQPPKAWRPGRLSA
eukprot:1096220-Alexandrium_andersonii.AAC.1